MSTNVTKPPRFFPSKRFALSLLTSFALFLQYAQRSTLSMSIVCMVNKTSTQGASLESNSINYANKTFKKYGASLLSEKQFHWSEFDQQIVLGSQSVGYLCSVVPGSLISLRIGAKRTCIICILLSSATTILLSLIYHLQRASLVFVVILRIVTGIGLGPIYPSVYALWSKWAVPSERSTIMSIGLCSNNIGVAVSMMVGGIFCQYFTSGWVYVFVLTGSLGLICCLLWIAIVADSPQTDRTISERERNYILAHTTNTDKSRSKSSSCMSLPWKEMIRSKPLLALSTLQFFSLFALLFFYSNFGKLLTEVIRIPTQYAGYYLAGAYVFTPVSSLTSGFTVDFAVRTNKITLTNARKLISSLTSFVPALCLMILCFCDHTRQTIALLTVTLFLLVTYMSYGAGYVANFADIVPAYSSIIFAITSTISIIGAIFASIIAGSVLKRSVLEDWRKLFIMFAITYIFSGVIYLLYGSAVPETWAVFQCEQKKEDEGSTMIPENGNLDSKDKEISI